MATVSYRVRWALLGLISSALLTAWLWYRRSEYVVLCAALVNRHRLFKNLILLVHREFRRHQDADKYSMTLGWGPGYSVIEDRAICWEAPLGLTVWLNGEPAFGIAIEFHSNMIRIRQLQGVRGTKLPYTLRDWPQRLVKVMMRFAILSGMKGVCVSRAHLSLFYHYPHFDDPEDKSWKQLVTEHQARMRRRYDQTAQNLGFDMTEDWGVWCTPRFRARP